MKGDLISRSALLEELKEQHDYIMQDQEIGKTIKWCETVCFHRTVEAVGNAPAVDAETVIKSLPYVKEALEMAKQSLAPVVRCKDCDVPHNKWTGCPNLNGMIPPPEFYCAGAVRKKGADNAD